jgi:bacillithiol system protein YtxJ
MGFMDRYRQAQEEGIHDYWQTLDQAEQLNAIIERSHDKAQVIFKHSTRCGISSMAKHQLEHDWDLDAELVDMYYLDLIAHRDMSNQIADLTGVTHQSPQIILIRNGKAVFDTSHHAISVARIRAALEQTARG